MAKKNLDKVCYRDTYLKDVILMWWILLRLPKTRKKIPAKLTKAATKRFPISDIQTVHSQEFQVSPTVFPRMRVKRFSTSFMEKSGKKI